jgi:hypothetical protein
MPHNGENQAKGAAPHTSSNEAEFYRPQYFGQYDYSLSINTDLCTFHLKQSIKHLFCIFIYLFCNSLYIGRQKNSTSYILINMRDLFIFYNLWIFISSINKNKSHKYIYMWFIQLTWNKLVRFFTQNLWGSVENVFPNYKRVV